ncbi:hypothetical protein GH5_03870 [Leishmania sp. Ghana 2012 LV757]|uniref:hypothetical protein n=1 Tax=Leishmania sp. Ghana 2012 LV757 TaxID=2803181 RepID=UPI001B59DB98|nr:hypothetical protein GH5_03870 [Leishmania sp. Ghana 2012 LV757]
MKEPYRSTWRVYLPGLFVMSMFSIVVYFSRTRSNAVKYGYDFVPIYSEDGKLEGFTHPVLVKAGNQYRETEEQRKLR